MDLIFYRNKQEAFESLRPEAVKLKELTHCALDKFIEAQLHMAFVSFSMCSSNRVSYTHAACREI